MKREDPCVDRSSLLAFIGYVLMLGHQAALSSGCCSISISIFIAPQRIGYSLITSMPVSLIAFAAAFGGWMRARSQGRRAHHLSAGAAGHAAVACIAGGRLAMPSFPSPHQPSGTGYGRRCCLRSSCRFTLTTRARIEGLALTLVLSVATIVIGTGMKTVLGGGGYGSLKFFVNDNSGIYESSTLATVVDRADPVDLVVHPLSERCSARIGWLTSLLQR